MNNNVSTEVAAQPITYSIEQLLAGSDQNNKYKTEIKRILTIVAVPIFGYHLSRLRKLSQCEQNSKLEWFSKIELVEKNYKFRWSICAVRKPLCNNCESAHGPFSDWRMIIYGHIDDNTLALEFENRPGKGSEKEITIISAYAMYTRRHLQTLVDELFRLFPVLIGDLEYLVRY